MRKWTKEQIKALLAYNTRAVEKALLVLLARQTADERAEKGTKHTNGRGFNQADAPIMTDMARWVERGNHLSTKQLAWLRSGRSARYPSRIGKYAGQLAEVANENLQQIQDKIEHFERELCTVDMIDNFALYQRTKRELTETLAKLREELEKKQPKEEDKCAA